MSDYPFTFLGWWVARYLFTLTDISNGKYCWPHLPLKLPLNPHHVSSNLHDRRSTHWKCKTLQLRMTFFKINISCNFAVCYRSSNDGKLNWLPKHKILYKMHKICKNSSKHLTMKIKFIDVDCTVSHTSPHLNTYQHLLICHWLTVVQYRGLFGQRGICEISH